MYHVILYHITTVNLKTQIKEQLIAERFPTFRPPPPTLAVMYVWDVGAADSKVDHRIHVLCRVLRRGLHVGRRRLAASVLDGGGQEVLEASRPHPLLLRADRGWHGRLLDFGNLRDSFRPRRRHKVRHKEFHESCTLFSKGSGNNATWVLVSF